MVRGGAGLAAAAETLESLRRAFGDSLLRYELDAERGWLEDPILWRRGDPMLAAVSHEGEGALRITAAELAELEAAGIPTRDRGRWA